MEGRKIITFSFSLAALFVLGGCKKSESETTKVSESSSVYSRGEETKKVAEYAREFYDVADEDSALFDEEVAGELADSSALDGIAFDGEEEKDLLAEEDLDDDDEDSEEDVEDYLNSILTAEDELSIDDDEVYDIDQELISAEINAEAEPILFEKGSANPKEGELAKLSDNFVAKLAEATEAGHDIVIHGHACQLGDSKSNYELSKKRAEKIKEELVKKGIKEDKIKVIACGSEIPRRIVDSESLDDAERSQLYAENRRAEIMVV